MCFDVLIVSFWSVAPSKELRVLKSDFLKCRGGANAARCLARRARVESGGALPPSVLMQHPEAASAVTKTKGSFAGRETANLQLTGTAMFAC